MQLMKKVKNKKIKVILDGQGADELLGGYSTSVFIPSILDLLRSGKFNEILKTLKTTLKNFKFSYLIKIYLRDLSNQNHFISTVYHKFIGTEKIYLNQIKRFLRIRDYDDDLIKKNVTNLEKNLIRSHSGTLRTLLHYGDAISMANSIEVRNPFLDYRLVEFVFSLPPTFKVKLGVGKFIHRESFKNIVPDRILNNNSKLGYNTSISNELRNFNFLKILLEKKTIKRGLFHKKSLKKIINSHISKKKDFGSLLYRLISTELWFREFIDKNSSVNFKA
jgi:asparagine synthase (glutamine-hydrolysing)